MIEFSEIFISFRKESMKIHKNTKERRQERRKIRKKDQKKEGGKDYILLIQQLCFMLEGW